MAISFPLVVHFFGGSGQNATALGCMAVREQAVKTQNQPWR